MRLKRIQTKRQAYKKHSLKLATVRWRRMLENPIGGCGLRCRGSIVVVVVPGEEPITIRWLLNLPPSSGSGPHYYSAPTAEDASKKAGRST